MEIVFARPSKENPAKHPVLIEFENPANTRKIVAWKDGIADRGLSFANDYFKEAKAVYA